MPTMRPPATATALAVGRSPVHGEHVGVDQQQIRFVRHGSGSYSAALNPGSAISVCQSESPRCDGWWSAVIDRADDWDGDAVLAARNLPEGGERGDASSADSPTADDEPADATHADAALTAPEQRADAHRRYRDTVDHTYDITRVESGEDAPAEAQEAPPKGEATPDETPEPAPEAEGTSAGDAWAEAVTELRAEWEKHEQRFPNGPG